ncbi:MAG TPA: hypothetical protein VMD49_01430 [Steroidobacteraceae bacterium]|nr:hypothetical protein [Steroidobacteraceae bacterium]
MRKLATVWALGLLVGCSAPHAARVRCDARLVPINSSAAQSPEPLASIVHAPDAGAARSLVP